MRIGALIVTTGLPHRSGLTALLPKIGSVTAGARLIASAQTAGAGLICLITGPEQKQLEREFAQEGLLFLRCNSDDTKFFVGVRHGLSYLADKVDQILILPGDLSLVLPSTMEALLYTPGEIRIPVDHCMHGYPVALTPEAARNLLCSDEDSLEAALACAHHPPIYVEVDDPGILLRSGDMTHRGSLIARQNRQLRRPEIKASLVGEDTVFDKRLSMLLHLIRDTQSVRLACSMMQISYSTAWNLLNHAEDALGFPLVTRNRGGNSGSGTLLTQKGLALMEAYDRFLASLEQTARELYRDLFRQIETEL